MVVSQSVSQSVIFFSHRSLRRLFFFHTIERATHRRKGEMSQRKREKEKERYELMQLYAHAHRKEKETHRRWDIQQSTSLFYFFSFSD